MQLTSGAAAIAADLGIGYNAVRWICYYIRRVEEGDDPGADWRSEYYEPCLGRILDVLKRRPAW